MGKGRFPSKKAKTGGVIPIKVIDDDIVEGTETVTFKILEDNSTGAAQIYDNDSEANSKPNIRSITANSVLEGDGEL